MNEIYRNTNEKIPMQSDRCDMLSNPNVYQCRGKMCEGCAIANVPREYVQECMHAFGGSFARSLARSFQLSDPTNYKRLRAAFPDIWQRYAIMWLDAQPKGDA